jgi:alkane 1-monooxygenase
VLSMLSRYARSIEDPRRWPGPFRYVWLVGLVVPLLPLAAWGLVSATGWNLWWWLGPMWLFVLMPLLDAARGVDTTNPPEGSEERLVAERYYRIAVYAYLPLQYATFVWAAWFVTSADLSVASYVGLSLTVGLVAGIGINTAHELGHKRPRLERRLAKLALAQSAYGHFYVEHNRGHHTRVSTPEDPASARLGESFWAFLPRTVLGSLASAWHLERLALARRGRRWWSPRNDLLNAWALTVVLFVGVTVAFGAGVVPFLVIQAVFGFSLLEVVNYVEHYGLLRQRLASGRYERCRPEHSWNADFIASNTVLYNLQRHSDHHANPLRPYQVLRHFPAAPQLPAGYAGMITLAVVPPLYRRVMDPLVVAHYGGDVTRANIQPRRRGRLLARYGPAGGG